MKAPSTPAKAVLAAAGTLVLVALAVRDTGFAGQHGPDRADSPVVSTSEDDPGTGPTMQVLTNGPATRTAVHRADRLPEPDPGVTERSYGRLDTVGGGTFGG